MIELPLEQINAQSPYEVSYAPNGDFVFATSLNIHYLISFETEEPVGGCNTFQFVIQKLENQRSLLRCAGVWTANNSASGLFDKAANGR